MDTNDSSTEGAASLDELASRHGFSVDAVRVMRDALQRGGGTQAQFSHPEFGGSGQWMQGGMTMVGDMFNDQLKRRVDSLCRDLVRLPASAGTSGGMTQQSDRRDAWWPEGLSNPSSTGGQNDARYAYFADAHRLVVDNGSRITVYDTGDHQISGVSQQQSGTRSLTFSSQHGPVAVAQLRVVQ
jgi:hypothetical protein